MRIRIEGYDPPSAPDASVSVGVQRLKAVEHLIPVTAASFSWDLDATLHRDDEGGLDLRGPYVHGKRGDRFLYLSWGTTDGGVTTMFRRAKLMLAPVDPATLDLADTTGRPLVGRLALRGRDGTPVCAAVRPPAITWSVG